MFANPLGLLALVAVPAIVGLHLYRRRYRPHAVGALFLWEEFADAPAAGRTRTPLTRSPSFWCELLAALFAALALAGPRPFSSQVPHRVVVLDASASMAARDDARASAWSRARAWLTEELGELPRRARVTLVTSGPAPDVIAGPAALRDEALAVLAAFEPGAASHAFDRALDLAEGLAGEGDVWLVTDSAAAPRARVALHAFGTPLANTAIVRATRRTVEGSVDSGEAGDVERIDLALANASDAAVRRTVELVALDPVTGRALDEDALVASSDVDVPPGAEAALRFEVAGARDVPLLVRIDADALSSDDRAYLVSSDPRTVRVAVHGSQDVRAAALLLDRTAGATPRVERIAAAVESLAPNASAVPHLLLDLDGTSGRAADANTWVLRAVPPTEPTAWIGPFLVERRHRLLDGVSLRDVAWVGDAAFDARGAELVRAGAAPLVVERRASGGREILLNADLEAGTFTRSPDWPILLANLVEWRRDALDGPRSANLVLGEPLEIGARAGGTWQLVGPLGSDDERTAEQIGGRDLVFDGVDAPGLYRLEKDGRRRAPIAVSFLDPTESDLRGLATLTRASSVAAGSGTVGSHTSRLEWLFALVALALVAADHWILSTQRRD